jgi:hypothetical protein
MNRQRKRISPLFLTNAPSIGRVSPSTNICQATDQSDADAIIEKRRREKQMLEAIH